MKKKKAEDYIGETINKLTILEVVEKRGKNKLKIFLCRCKCGNIVECIATKVITEAKKNCGCYWSSIKVKFVTKDITLGFWTKLKNVSRERNNKGRQLDFNITPEYLQEIWDNQKGLCYFSNRQLYISKSTEEYKNGMTTASVDRIDNSKGYVIGNIRFVHKIVNLSKRILSDEIYLSICRKVSYYANEKKV